MWSPCSSFQQLDNSVCCYFPRQERKIAAFPVCRRCGISQVLWQILNIYQRFIGVMDRKLVCYGFIQAFFFFFFLVQVLSKAASPWTPRAETDASKTSLSVVILSLPGSTLKETFSLSVCSVMLTAGYKLTSTVNPKRDTAVGLRQVRSFEAVLVLKAAVRRLLRSRTFYSNVCEIAVKY